MRIVSLLPSATEIVLSLGLETELVGVTFECDVPSHLRDRVTVVVGGRDTSGLTPAEIDTYVRAQLAAGADLYTLHRNALAALAPDLILTQDLCRVCALPTDEVTAALDQLGCRSDVITLDPHSLVEVLADIGTVGQQAGVASTASAVVEGLQDRLGAVAARVSGRPSPRVAVIEWVEPVFSAGHWIPDLVTAAGGTPVAAHPHRRSVPTTWASIAEAAPDIVVMAPCGYRLQGAAEQARAVLNRLPPDVAVWAIDADGLIVRPGPRVVDGVEALASIFHPSAVPARPSAVTRVRAER